MTPEPDEILDVDGTEFPVCDLIPDEMYGTRLEDGSDVVWAAYQLLDVTAGADAGGKLRNAGEIHVYSHGIDGVEVYIPLPYLHHSLYTLAAVEAALEFMSPDISNVECKVMDPTAATHDSVTGDHTP